VVEEDNIMKNDEKFTGIEAPEIKPIDEDYIMKKIKIMTISKKEEEETWLSNLWPAWGDEDTLNITTR
jgi:hypothetical protein